MKGNQIPRIRIEPERVDTDGKAAGILMEAYGLKLDEWQQLVLDCWLGKDAAGSYTVTSGGISCPRQCGKNVIIEAREFYGLIINGERILHTAHQVRTSKKSFRRLEKIFTDKRHPEIMQAVKKIRYGIGEESIEMMNGGIIEFTSRSRQAARGYDGISLIILDEAQEVTDEVVEALMSTVSASTTGQRQILYAGTPPYVGCSGQVFRRFRQACIGAEENGKENSNSWHEWGIDAESLNDIDISDRRLWYEANPALGYRLSEKFTAEEMRTLTVDGFARERLGWWAKPLSAKIDLAIDKDAWEACKSDDDKPEGKTAYAVKFSPDGSQVVLAGAVLPADGKGRISIIDVQPTGNGLQWLASWLNDRYKVASCVVIDGRNGADVLIDKIRSVWVFKDSVIKPGARDVCTAASMLLNDLNERSITWYSQQEELNESAITATKRGISGGWGFGGANSALIEACSLALWGCRTSKRNPQRKMRLDGSNQSSMGQWFY